MTEAPWFAIVAVDIIIVLLAAHATTGIKRLLGGEWKRYSRYAIGFSFMFSAGGVWAANGFLVAVHAMTLTQ